MENLEKKLKIFLATFLKLLKIFDLSKFFVVLLNFT